MIISMIMLAVGIVSVGYFILYMCMVDLNNVFTYFWLFLGILGIAGGIFLFVLHHRHMMLPRWLVQTAVVLAGVCLLIFVVVEGIIIGYGKSKPDPGADYVVVLGARVRGEQVLGNLARRLQAACAYLEENPQTKVIVSGGQGAGEDISEAAAMKGYLIQQGIGQDRIIMEDQSVNTDQNLAYSIDKMGSTDGRVVIVSNDFHIFRALALAKKKGLEHVQGLGSSTVWYTAPNLFVREAMAVMKYAACGQI